jgi:hypothetical protein
MATLATKKSPKVATKFFCEKCNYICSKKSDFDKHLLTAKHNFSTNGNKKLLNTIMCECGKKYKDRTGLWKHKKKCNFIHNNENKNNLIAQDNIVNNLMKQNEQLHKLIINRDEEQRKRDEEHKKEIEKLTHQISKISTVTNSNKQ